MSGKYVLALGLVLFLVFDGATAYRGRIVNGTQAFEGEFPFMLSLRRFVTGRHMCGASLLNRAWALTAAHCVAGTFPARVNLQFGSNQLDAKSKNVVNVSKIFVHEGYLPQNKYIHDIALIKLKTPLVLSAQVSTIRLPEMRQATPSNESAVLIGWGHNATGGVTQTQLQKVYLKTYSHQECSVLHEIDMHETTICAGVPEGGKGQCSGDSGGPLLVDGRQVGIVSWSRKPCTIAPYPGVFTEVAAYVDWILKTIGDETELEESNSIDETANNVSLRHATTLKHFCAGTIVAEKWILTAAHCFTFLKEPHEVIIQFGSNQLKPKNPKLIKVREIILHAGYNPTVAIHDIALLRLATSILEDFQANHIQLPRELAFLGQDNNVTLVGWGFNELDGHLQQELQKVHMNLLDFKTCRQVLPAFVHTTNLCAFAEGKGQCSGDSGGPLLQGKLQVGIVSWSLKPCGSYAGIFTNVASYANWIDKYIVGNY